MSKLLRELEKLVEELESNGYEAAPPRLMPGEPLKMEDLAPVFWNGARVVYSAPEEPKSDLEVWYAISK